MFLDLCALSYNMVGQFKFSMVILGGFVLFRDPLQGLQLLGIVFTFSGTNHCHSRAPLFSDLASTFLNMSNYYFYDAIIASCSLHFMSFRTIVLLYDVCVYV